MREDRSSRLWLVFRDTLIQNFHGALFFHGIEAGTAPFPVVLAANEAASDRVLVHVVKLFSGFLFGPDIEVVKAALPDLSRQGFVCFPQIFRGALFDDLKDRRWQCHLSFVNQQMEVFRHNDVAENPELILQAGFFEDLQEDVAASWAAQDGKTVITAAGDEVEVSYSVISCESRGHFRSIETRFHNSDGVERDSGPEVIVFLAGILVRSCGFPPFAAQRMGHPNVVAGQEFSVTDIRSSCGPRSASRGR
jgi:hypothetical protein